MPSFGLEGYAGLIIYTAGIVAFLLSVFWRPEIGLYYLIPLIPLQTIRYRMNELPLGASVVYVILLGVALGLLRRHESILPKTPWTTLLCVQVAFLFLSMCAGSVFMGFPLPLFANDRRFSDWCNYTTMPVLFFLVAAAVKDVRQIKIMVLLICLTGLVLDRAFWSAVHGRDFSSYSDELRDEGGAMGYAGVNGLAAFEAQFATFTLALAGFERKRLRQLGYFALAGFSAVCLMYALSRGAYVAFLAGWLLVGVLHQRKLLVLLVIFACVWASVVPSAVRTRVEMTYDENGNLESSAGARVTLWDDALQMASANMVLGTGYNTYAYMHRVGHWNDTHSIYVKVLVETGVIGLTLLLWLLGKGIWQGLRLFRHAKDPFLAGLGLGLAGWVFSAAVANVFGDRWNYFQIQGFLWVIAGLVARALILQEEDKAGTDVCPRPLEGEPAVA